MKPILIGMMAAILAAGAQSNEAERQLKAAVNAELVNGDLRAAIKQYGEIAAKYAKSDRAVTAMALVHMAEAYQKMGDAESRKIYEQVVREYADQPEPLRVARSRLSALEGPSRRNGSTMAIRRVWADYPVDTGSGMLFCAPSPDGRYISFEDLNTGDLAVRDLTTGQTRPVADAGLWSKGFALGSVFSADSKQIAYQWLEFKEPTWGIHIVGLDGSPARLLYRNAEVSWPVPVDWSGDGKHILALLSGRPDRTNQISLIAVADGSVRVLKTLDWRSPRKMSFSPDGRYIAYDLPPRDDSPNRDIFVLATDGRQEVVLVEHPADDFLLGWAPDGKTVLFASDRTGSIGAWMIRVADGKPVGAPELVKPDLGRIQPLGFARNGSYYYGLTTGVRDLYVADLDPATGKLVSGPAPAAQRYLGTNRAPDWSPDGRYLAYLSKRGNAPNQNYKDTICIRSAEGGEVRELSSKVGFLSWLAWYPDGRFLLVQSYGAGKHPSQSLFRVDAQTGEATLVARGSGNVPVLSPDGRTIFYGRDAPPEGNQILARDLATDRETVLYRGRRIRLTAVSPDGRYLAFIQQGPNSLRVMPATGGELREVVGGLGLEGPSWLIPVAWTPDGRYLLFGKYGKESTELWQVPFEGGDPQRLGMAMGEAVEGLRVHADGRRMVFVAGRPKGEVWVMENFLSAPGALAKR